jgi:hypothetical protein
MAMMVVGSIWLCAALARLCRDDRRLLAAIVGVLGAYLVLLVARPEWIAISPLGPTQNSRFWGIGNQLETLMVVPVVVGAAIAARRYRIAGLTAFSLLALVLITDNRLGSDGGGAIVFGVALAYVGARCCGLGARGFATLLGLSATVVLGVITLNLRSPTPDHLRSAFVHGWSGVARVVIDRIPLAYRPAWQHWQLFLPLGVLLAGAFLVALRIADRRARDLVLASGIALATSLLVNDSAVYEATAGIAVISAVARFSTPTAPVAFRVPARARVALRAED